MDIKSTLANDANSMEISPEANESTAVLFVCTGNTCRSPMAAAVLNAKGSHRVKSAGVAAFDGSSITDHAASALEEAGVSPDVTNYRNHSSRTVDEELMKWADVVVAVTGKHYMQLLFRFPEHAEKIRALAADVEDPFGGSIDDYRECLRQIITAVNEMFP